MKTEQEILNEYDGIFEMYHLRQDEELKHIDYPPPVAFYGLSCGSGWNGIIDELCADLREIDPDITAHQVKEKFGGLRFYTGGTSEEALDRIQEAADDSFETCEWCGAPGSRDNDGGWVRTLCDPCSRQYEYQRFHEYKYEN